MMASSTPSLPAAKILVSRMLNMKLLTIKDKTLGRILRTAYWVQVNLDSENEIIYVICQESKENS